MEPSRDQCAFYFTKDQIENLQIRVALQQLTGSQLVDASPRVVEDAPADREGDVPLTTLLVPTAMPRETGTSRTQYVTVKWQQKILSACETEEYKRPVYAEDPKYRERHKQALKWKNQRIFTYTHQDNYQYKVQQRATTSRKLEPECHLRQRTSRARGSSILSTTDNEAHEVATEGSKKKHPSLVQQQYFYIMADLAPLENLGESQVYETILCVLKYDSQGQVIVTPDFTRPTTKAYRLESFGPDNALYEYQIENVSLTRSAEERHQEEQLTAKLAKQRIEEVQQVTGVEWGPEVERGRGELRLVVMGEIIRALHFTEASSLYVHYSLYLPPGWRVNPGTESEGFTTACRVSHVDNTPSTHFSTPFSFDVTRSLSGRGWPLLLLAVFSLNWLGQDRDEGYAAFSLPAPASHDGNGHRGKCSSEEGIHLVGTWRPAQGSPLAKMHRFFLGGCQLMSDPSYLAVGASTNSQVGVVSRLGFNTLSSGFVELRANTLAQADFIENGINVPMENPPGWQLSTLAVIDAFNKSRQKLREAKQGLQSVGVNKSSGLHEASI